MRAYFSIVVVACVTVALSGCEKNEGVPLPVPPNAKEVRHHRFEGGGAAQTSFVVNATYPDRSAAKFYLEHVKMPWIRCFERIPEWVSFGDVSKGNNLFIHQVAMHWVNRQERKHLMLALRYQSPESTYRKIPGNDQQHVIVVEYQQDPKEAINWLKLKCEA